MTIILKTNMLLSCSLSVTAYRRATSLVRERHTLIFRLTKELYIRVHFIVGDDAFHRPVYYLTRKQYDNYFENKYVVIPFSLSVTAYRRATSIVRERLAAIVSLSKDENPTNIYTNGTMWASSPTLFW